MSGSRSILNYIVMIIGFLTILFGIIKLYSSSHVWSLDMGDQLIVIPVHNSMFFIVVVNFIGGLCMLLHAFLTLRFRELKISSSDSIDDENGVEMDYKNLVGLSKLNGFTGIVTLLISLFLIVEVILILVPFLHVFTTFYLLFIFYILILMPYSAVPLWLVIKNFRFNNKILDRRKYLKNKMLREAISSKKNLK